MKARIFMLIQVSNWNKKKKIKLIEKLWIPQKEYKTNRKINRKIRNTIERV